MEAITIILGLAVVLVIGNMLIYRWVVSRAMKKFIRPYFTRIGYEIRQTKFVGLLKTGDFKVAGFPLRPFMPKGNPMQTTYVYLYLSKGSGPQVRITARIDTLFLFIRKVEYSSLPVKPS
ncbi:hypothetical protein [Pararcticibacter amylolyticus]|uniref:Uncharacterized protein n=1 Tax=Pararcticibacter amylolyticus TaxID=2173175 RepID=A0A2U2P9J9_9SPHI|nr:hypothetical protein [Pararcticibacter amylolyticus]PWG78015.1 hypothetical protein DDR33_24435 [Pararcticibacter amylolyticus]